MTASDIGKLLKARHSKDVYIPECKTGATYTNSHLHILDAWVMIKSWVHPKTIGYEIKVSRSDFLNDNKWHEYLCYCNEFYFVCPSGLIQINELPPEVGLMYVSKTGAKLFKKKPAIYRDIEIPETIWRYILMARSQITNGYTATSNKEYWQNWLEHKRIDRYFGTNLSKTIRKTIDEEILKQREINEKLQYQVKGLEDVKEFCEKIGFDMNNFGRYSSALKVENKIKEISNGVPNGFVNEIEMLISQLARFKELIEEKL